jgi:predicted metal-binding protein
MTMDMKHLEQIGQEAGFSRIAPLEADTIQLLPDVRNMCEVNNCGAYGTIWSCPPACGTLEECEERVRRYHRGILVQTTGELEDEFDGEGMMETEARHKENFTRLHDVLIKEYPQMLSLGAGGCRRCKKCTYPDAPCRFPEKKFASMEAYGMLVTQVCQDNGLDYYYGKGTITYTSCFLLE